MGRVWDAVFLTSSRWRATADLRATLWATHKYASLVSSPACITHLPMHFPLNLCLFISLLCFFQPHYVLFSFFMTKNTFIIFILKLKTATVFPLYSHLAFYFNKTPFIPSVGFNFALKKHAEEIKPHLGVNFWEWVLVQWIFQGSSLVPRGFH
jgi:hypothetical protein